MVCCTDQRLLLRILENLISNALKFARSRVLVAARQRRGAVEIWVVDNGPGMPAIYANDVYKAFVQGGTLNGGYGLGLSIVKRLSDQIGVTLSIRSRPGRGTTVRLKFPHRADTGSGANASQDPTLFAVEGVV
jgi:signal transduction histidine kinase